MRTHLKRIPLYAPVAHVSPETADSIVADGAGHSLRGRAVLMLNQARLQEILSDTDVDPEIAELILRAAARVEADRAAASIAAAQSDSAEGR